MKTILVILLFFFSSVASADDRGCFFYKKKYDNQPIPNYNEKKDLLPKPILDDHKDWINLYWKAWEIAFSRITKPQEGSPLVSNWIDEALSPQIFQWDTHYMALFGRYAHHIFPFINSHDNFYASQHPDGMICRVINEDDGTDHWWGLGPDNARAINPPLFSWAEVQTYMVTGDKKRLADVLEPIERYVEWVEKNRCSYDTPHKLYWSNGQASGMDNTPRDEGRPEPGDGWDSHSAIDHMGWVDMSAQMVMCYNDLSYMCKELGHEEKSLKYKKMADEISDRINKWLWDDNKGLYFDVTPEGNKTEHITAAAFWPMLAGITSQSQNVKLVSNLKNPDLFWRNTPVPTLAANQPDYDKMGRYWKGGVWAPVNYMIVEGLKKNGYRELAIEISKRYLETLSKVYDKTKTFWELYSPEIYSPATNASGIYMVEPNFVGWTGLGPISMMIETIIGIRLDAPSGTITWDINERSKHGVKDLTFGGGKVDLMATPGTNGYEISLYSEKPIKVIIRINGNDYVVDLKSGQRIIKNIRINNTL